MSSNGLLTRLRRFMGPGASDVPPGLASLGGTSASVVPLDYTRRSGAPAGDFLDGAQVAGPILQKGAVDRCLDRRVDERRRGAVDVGANVGAFSLIAAKVCARRGTVVAFEPGFASYAHLCANIVLNRCESIIVPLPVALGSTNGLGSFAYLTLDPGQSRHQFRQQAWVAEEADTKKRYLQPVSR